MVLNDVFMAAAIGWLFSQAIKFVLNLIRGRDRKFWNFMWASGFPSTHSALTISTSVYVGLKFGTAHPLFGLTLILTFIVIYDRIKINQVYAVIRSVYPDLNERAREKGIDLEETFGHRLIEVAAGILVGILAGLVSHALMG